MKRIILIAVSAILAVSTFAVNKSTYTFAEKDGQELKLDVYMPEDSLNEHPCIVFAFGGGDGSNDYLPHNYSENCVVYCGTHDNSTIKGWIKAADKADVDAAMNYMLIKQKKDFVWNMLSMMWMSVANTAIAQAQDILELDDKARMNIPSTSSGNWMWRAKKGVFTDELAEKVAKYTRRYGRSNKN